jgi:bacteriorhodopsin
LANSNCTLPLSPPPSSGLSLSEQYISNITTRQQKRLFHILTTFLLAISTLSYYAQATGSGSFFAHHILTIPHTQHIPPTHEHVFRQVLWARYVDWALTSPLIILNLAFVAGLDGSNILIALFADWAMVFTGWFFAYAHAEGQRWGWYAMSCVAFLVVVHQLAVPGRRAVLNKDRRIMNIFASIAGYEMIVWALFLIEIGELPYFVKWGGEDWRVRLTRNI